MPELGELIDFERILNFVALIAALAPGFILIFCRSFLISSRVSTIAEAAAEYLIVSSIYYAMVLPIFIWFDSLSWHSFSAVLFFVPAIFGFLLGFLAQRGYLRNLFARFGIGVVGNQSTAWEAAFSQVRGGIWVVVTLLDGKQFWGYMGGRSHAARDLAHRDIFIERVTDSRWHSVEGADRSRGIWIPGSQIAMLEIIEDLRS